MPPEGSICWVEHVSPEHRAAVPFYTRLLGLDEVDDTGSFVFLRRNGDDVMAAYSMPDRLSWLPYVASSDAVAAVDRARRAGGTVHREATPVGDAGWSAWVADPEGTMIGIWQAGTHKGYVASGAAGTVCRVDRHTRQLDAAERFLTDAFGLARLPSASDGLVSLAAPGGEPVHLVAMDERWADARAGWVVYFGVPDVDEAARATSDSGGRVLLGPKHAPGVGDFAVLSDPLSLSFGVVGVL